MPYLHASKRFRGSSRSCRWMRVPMNDVRYVTSRAAWSDPGAFIKATVPWGDHLRARGCAQPPSEGQPSGGPLAVYYPCTDDLLERQVAGAAIL